MTTVSPYRQSQIDLLRQVLDDADREVERCQEILLTTEAETPAADRAYRNYEEALARQQSASEAYDLIVKTLQG